MSTMSPAAPNVTAPNFRIPAPQGPSVTPGIDVSRPARVRPSRATFVRRRIFAAIAVVVVALGLVLTTSAMQAEAGGATPISAGHVVVQPGQSMWDVASQNAPAGMDLRTYLLALEQLNGVHADSVAAWDVLLLPVLR